MMSEGVTLRNLQLTPEEPGRFTVRMTLEIAADTSLEVAAWALSLLEGE